MKKCSKTDLLLAIFYRGKLFFKYQKPGGEDGHWPLAVKKQGCAYSILHDVVNSDSWNCSISCSMFRLCFSTSSFDCSRYSKRNSWKLGWFGDRCPSMWTYEWPLNSHPSGIGLVAFFLWTSAISLTVISSSRLLYWRWWVSFFVDLRSSSRISASFRL